MQKRTIGLIGASGYAGAEATALLSSHPMVDVAFLTSERWAGRAVHEAIGIEGQVGMLLYASTSAVMENLQGIDAVLLATPLEASLALAPLCLEAGAKVIDLSGAYRLRDEATFAAAYGERSPEREALAKEAAYGLPELCRGSIAGKRLVANPGCYPTAAQLALAPLLRAGLLDPDSLVINALSGTTGAGRRREGAFSFSEVADDVRPYRIFDHQHVPELEQTLGDVAGHAVALTFTPHLLPIRRGILVTIHARLVQEVQEEALLEVFEASYADEPFIELARSAGDVTLRRVVGTNRCRIGCSAKGDRLIVTAAIDNLLKGAAGQAVQNLNLLFGWDEASGLSLSPSL